MFFARSAISISQIEVICLTVNRYNKLHCKFELAQRNCFQESWLAQDPIPRSQDIFKGPRKGLNVSKPAVEVRGPSVKLPPRHPQLPHVTPEVLLLANTCWHSSPFRAGNLELGILTSSFLSVVLAHNSP